MSRPVDPGPTDEDLEDRLRGSFTATRVPPAPTTIRDRVSDLLASEQSAPRRNASPRMSTAWRAAAAVVVAVGLIGTMMFVVAQSRPTASPQPSGQPSPKQIAVATGPVMAGNLFLPGQTLAGDGWRLIAGGARLRREPIVFDGGGRIELFYGGGLEKPIEMLEIPKDAPPVDAANDALLVIDFLVGGGPICGQVRFDGVTFDAAQRIVTARYEEGLLVTSLPSGPPVLCTAIGVPATILVAISRDHLVAGQLTLHLERGLGGDRWVDEASRIITAPIAPVPLSDATVADAAGTFPGGGLWATRGTTLHLSIDGGATWEAATMPVAASPFVLDPRHIWIVSTGPGSTPYAGDGTDIEHFVLDRSGDGGRTWQRSDVAGNFASTTPVLAFSDATHGYLLAAGLRGGGGSFVLRTDDGGATWQTVTSIATYLGAVFGLGPNGTLWAGTQGDAGPVGRPVLDVSRDGGRTWADARLPGLVGSIFATNTVLVPPAFFGSDGVVAVSTPGTDGQVTQFYASADGGGSWKLVAGPHPSDNGSLAVSILDPRHWVTAGSGPDSLQMTDDAGQTWQTIAASGLHGEPPQFLDFTDSLHGAAFLPLGDTPAPYGLVVTSDGGLTWIPATFSQ
jgi:photosystem II stability/assembly factor-like uncharacterized protein